MALPLQDTTGIAIPVSLVSAPVISYLIDASQPGHSKKANGVWVSTLEYTPPELFADILDTSQSSADPAGLWVVFLNALNTPLNLVQLDLVHGGQAGYPAVCDLNGSILTTHQIPATRTHPLDATIQLCGVGVWHFKSLAAGIMGAMQLCYNGGLSDATGNVTGPLIGVAWNTQEYAVTADVKKYGDLKGFYDKTVDSGLYTISDIGKEIAVMVGFASRDGGVPDALTVYVRYKLPTE